MKFWTEFWMLDETRYSHSHTFIQHASPNILKFKSSFIQKFKTADIATLAVLHELMDSDDGKQENGCKREARGDTSTTS